MNMNETAQIDIKEILMTLLRRCWILVLCAVIAGGAAYAYTSNFVTPLYRSRTRLYVNNTNKPKVNSSSVSAADIATSERLVTTYLAILQSDSLLEKVAEEAGVNYTAGSIRSMMSAGSVNETEVFDVSISHPDPQIAMDIANAVAAVAQKELAIIVEGSSTRIIDQAKKPTAPYSPDSTRNAMVGAAAGFALAAVAIVLGVLLDVRIKSEDDLARISNAPVLGRVPNFDTERDDGYTTYVSDDNRKAAK